MLRKCATEILRNSKLFAGICANSVRSVSGKGFPASYDTNDARYQQFNENSPVWACNEWDQLEELIVGRPDFAVVPNLTAETKACIAKENWGFYEANNGKYWADVIPEHWKKLVNEVDAFVRLLESVGLKVVRPDKFDHGIEFATPYFRSKGFYNAMSRDLLMVVGDEIIEATMGWRQRFFEYIPYRNLIKDYWRRGAKWTAAPKPTLDPRAYDTENDFSEGTCKNATPGKPVPMVTTEFEPIFDAADAIRAGKDIFIQRSHVTNQCAIEWLRTHLAPRGIRVHELTFNDPRPMHIDGTFTLVRPGIAFQCPERPCQQKEMFERAGWKLLDVSPPLMSKDHPLWLSSKWLSLNTLMFNQHCVFAEKYETGIHELFNKVDVEVIPISIRHMNSIGGGFHCWTVDIKRKGKMESYF